MMSQRIIHLEQMLRGNWFHATGWGFPSCFAPVTGLGKVLMCTGNCRKLILRV